jgi:hypothetical protein
MDKEEVTKEEAIDLKGLIKYALTAFTVLGTIAAGFGWLDSRYVNEDMFEQHIVDVSKLEEKIGTLIELIEEDRQRDKNEVLKAVKDSQIAMLTVRRDVLLSREGYLTKQEKAELEVLNTKLQELNYNR